MGGRRKEPVDLILAKGKSNHLTKEEIEKRRKEEIQAKSDCILIPEFVPKCLRDEFWFIAQQLLDIGIMSNLDVDCLGRYVVYQHEWERAYSGLSKIKPYIKIGNEVMPNEYYEKAINTINKLQKACKQEAGGLGLSISDRCKLVIPFVNKEEPTEKDPFDALFGGDE